MASPDPDYFLLTATSAGHVLRRDRAMQELVAIRTDGEYCGRMPTHTPWGVGCRAPMPSRPRPENCGACSGRRTGLRRAPACGRHRA